jgi:hypothetical protein
MHLTGQADLSRKNTGVLIRLRRKKYFMLVFFFREFPCHSVVDFSFFYIRNPQSQIRNSNDPFFLKTDKIIPGIA